MTSIASCLINLLSLTDSASQENLLRQHQQNSQSQEEPLTKLSRKKTMRKTFISESGQRVYICYFEECSRHFNHLSSLIKHERIHRDQKPYACSICGFRFTQSSNCKRHEKSHTGEKSYQCSQCPKRFSNSYNLRHHMEIHKQELEGISYSCSGCNKVYTYLSSLIKHRKKCLNLYLLSGMYERDSPKDNVEVSGLPKKLIKSEPELEENLNCFPLKERNINFMSIKEGNSDFIPIKEENNELNNINENISPNNHEKKIDIPTECKVEANGGGRPADLPEQRECISNFSRTLVRKEALEAFNEKKVSIPSELRSQVLFNIANSPNDANPSIESLRKTIMSNNLLLSQLVCLTQMSPAYNPVFHKQLEEIIRLRKFLHEQISCLYQSKDGSLEK